VGSIDVLNALCANHPDVRWSWVLGAVAWRAARSKLAFVVTPPLLLPRLALSGADTFADLRAGRWKQSDTFMQRVHIFVVARPGAPPPDVAGCAQVRAAPALAPSAAASGFVALHCSPRPPLQVTLVPVPGLTDVSSSAVRATLASGGDVTHVLHPDVLQYIRAHALYTSSPTTTRDDCAG
jgi:hypothetical protein